MIKTFISHSSDDHYFVDWLKIKLDKENIGLDIIVDEDFMYVGDKTQKLLDEIKKTIIFIPILSPTSIKKDFVLNEIKTAIENPATNVFPIIFKCKVSEIPEFIKNEFKRFDIISGIQCLDFSIEREWDNEYSKLRIGIIKKINELGLLREKNIDFYQDCGHIDLVLSVEEPTNMEIKSMAEVYLTKEEYRKYFFSNLDNIYWLKYLKNYGYFISNPSPIESKDSPKTYLIPRWPILDYLENISINIEEGDKENISIILDIIIEVTNYKDSSGNSIDNYITWWYFIKVLINLPNEDISLEIINFITLWLDSRFNNTLPGSEIAKRLLPKFLKNTHKDDCRKANEIFKIITDIKWEDISKERLDILGREKEPKLILDNYYLLEAFKKNLKDISKNISNQTIFIIADRIKKILYEENKIRKEVIELGKKEYYIMVTKINEFDYEFTLGTLKKSKEEKDPEEYLFSFTNRKAPELKSSTIFYLKECKNEATFIKKITNELIKDKEYRDIKEDKNLNEKFSKLFEYINRDYSYIWFKSFDSDLKHKENNPQNVLMIILRDLLLTKISLDKKLFIEIANSFLSNKYQYPIFRRLVFHIIKIHWKDFKKIFWKYICATGKYKILDDVNCEIEIYKIFQQNVGKFSNKEKKELEEMIESGPQIYKPKENIENYIIKWKQRWYSSLKKDKYFQEKYESLKRITKQTEKIELEDKRTVSSGRGESPLSKKEILEKTNKELVSYLNSFKSHERFEGPTTGGLAGLLNIVARENPSKFIDNINPFQDVGYLYVYNLLDGLLEAWKTKKIIDWYKLLNFINKYIRKKDFWENKLIVPGKEWPDDYKPIIGLIGKIIQEGTKDDSWAISKDYFNLVQTIVIYIFKKLKNSKEVNEEDYNALNDSLNTHSGKIITAYIFLILRIYRLSKSYNLDFKRKFIIFKNIYNKLLRNNILEAFTLIGRYLTFIYRLDKKWIRKIINTKSIFKEKINWESFMEGYLFNKEIYLDIYKIMRNHYTRAINNNFNNKNVESNLTQIISMQYLEEVEAINEQDSLFRIILDNFKISHLIYIINYFYHERDKIISQQKGNSDKTEIKRNKIIDFWRFVYKKLLTKKRYNKEEKLLLSNLVKLTFFLSNINEESFEWLSISAPFVMKGYNSPVFIDCLEKFNDDKSIDYIGKVFLKMIDKAEQEKLPDFDIEKIIKIVEKVFKVNKNDAVKICNIYGSRGYTFLKDLYDKYN